MVRDREHQDLPGLLRELSLHMPLVTFQQSDQLGEIVIDNPPQNLFNGEVLADLGAALVAVGFLSSTVHPCAGAETGKSLARAA